MLKLLEMDVAAWLAVVWLFAGLFLPVIAFWFLYRVARDLRRIADALEVKQPAKPNAPDAHLLVLDERGKMYEGSIANSAFGR